MAEENLDDPIVKREAPLEEDEEEDLEPEDDVDELDVDEIEEESDVA